MPKTLNCLINFFLRRHGIIPQESIHCHNETWSTETALRAVHPEITLRVIHFITYRVKKSKKQKKKQNLIKTRQRQTYENIVKKILCTLPPLEPSSKWQPSLKLTPRVFPELDAYWLLYQCLLPLSLLYRRQHKLASNMHSLSNV